MIRRRSFLAAPAAALPALIGRGPAQADTRYPDRPVTLLVGFGAGGLTDVMARYLAEMAREKLGVPVVVENRPGAGSTIATQRMAQARRDGYTLGVVTSSPYTIFPHIQPVPYEVQKDFTFIGQFLVTPAPAYVLSSNPYRSWQDLVAGARARPDSLRWTSSGARGAAHIATGAAFQKEGVKAIYVPFTGIAEGITSLLNGTIDMIVSSDFGPLLQDNKVRLLAEIGTERLPGMEALPTFAELGYPLPTQIYYGLGGPANLPTSIVATWENLLREVVASDGWKQLTQRYHAVSSFMESRDFAARVLGDYARMGPVIRGLGFNT
jgi:tripartite-type tricarboxylate transporter receptor subunit TctC